jgi:hypothetical protein
MSGLYVRSALSLFVFFAFQVWGPTSSVAQPYSLRGSDAGISLFDVAENSARIARIQVLAREPVWMGLPGKSGVCGYVYRVKVLDSLKGGDLPFEFFSADGNWFEAPDHDYLALIFQHGQTDLQALKSLKFSLSSDQYDLLFCQMQFDYYAPSLFRAVRSFDPVASKQLGGKWLGPAIDHDISWCIRTDHPVDPPDIRKITKDHESYDVLNWTSAKSLIRRALKAGGFLDDTC